MQAVTIYTKPLCSFCIRAKTLLGKKGVDFEEIDVMMNNDARHEMQARSGGALSVPQIFVGAIHVGGCDDLHALDKAGELDTLLRG